MLQRLLLVSGQLFTHMNTMGCPSPSLVWTWRDSPKLLVASLSLSKGLRTPSNAFRT
jgi:hypothetical protein